MFTGTLYPNDPTKIDGEPPAHHVSLTPQRLNESNNTKQQRGNDEYYSTLFDNSSNENNDPDGGRFKVRVVISKANEGVTATKFYHGLFDFASNQTANNNNNNNSGGGITEEMIQQNDTLQKLKQHVLDARIANEDDKNNNASTMGGTDPPILGYEVTIMLCEPHIQNEDIVIPPPSYLDKCDNSFNPVPCPKDEEDHAMYNERRLNNNNNQGGIFATGNISQSLQFVSPGPWEKANLDAFELIALDVKKALVRVEFPIFPEGCREKTFREVYQLNARVRVVFAVYVDRCYLCVWKCLS